MSVGERRIARRASVAIAAIEECRQEEQSVFAVNISEHGMRYFRPKTEALRKNREVVLTFSLADGLEPIKALAWVVEERVVTDRIASHVTFMFLQEQEEELIRQFVASASR